MSSIYHLIICGCFSYQIRRDYRKFVRQQPWLPKCLRCTKSGSGSVQSSSSGPNGSANVAPAGSPQNMMASESSPSSNHHGSNFLVAGNQALTVGGTMSRAGNRQNILVERAFASGTLRGTASTKSIVGQGSPTSSACSSHLIYNAGTQRKHQYDVQKQEMVYPHTMQSQQFHQIHSQQQSPIHHADAKNFLQYNVLDEVEPQNGKFVYGDRKAGSKTMKPQHSPHSPGQHDYFYFAGTGASPTTNTTGKQKNLKKMMHYSPSGGNQSPTINNSIGKNSLGSDGMGGQSSHSSSNSNGKHPASYRTDAGNDLFNGQELNQRQSRLGYYNHHQQQLQQQQQHPLGAHIMMGHGTFGGYGPDEPVYEEILSNRMSDAEDFSDEIHHRQRTRSRKPLHTSGSRNGDDDDAHDPCLNDDDESMHSNYRMRNGADDTLPQHHLNRWVNEFQLHIVVWSNHPYPSIIHYISNVRFCSSFSISRAMLKNTLFAQQQQSNVQHAMYQPQPPPNQQIGRNISAMLDENNTVVCYLEPITKS